MTQCVQTLNNGNQCNAPAVNGSLFCRHHDPQREIDEELKLKSRRKQPFSLPDFHNTTGVLAAITEVMHAMADRRIKRCEAETFIHGLKFAAKLITEIAEAGDVSSRALTDDSDRFQQPAPHRTGSAVDQLHEPTQLDLDELIDTTQRGTPQSDKSAATQTAWAGVTRPSNRALARLAASGNFAPGVDRRELRARS